VRRSAIPPSACALALAWCTAQLLDSGWLAALVCVLAIPGACLPALVRRRRRAATATVLTAMAAAMAALLAPLLLGLDGAAALALQLSFALVLTPLVPLAYAATFPDDDGDRR
jgi:hypothetical protein